VTAAGRAPAGSFRHEVLLYAGAGDFVDRAAPIVLSALEAEDAVLIALDSMKIELLRDRLGNASGAVAWKDIRHIGANPARIIPVWRQFVARHGPERGLLGFGEPVWAERAPAELVEAQRHEQLLNLAFADLANFTLLCPYDTERLGAGVLDEGLRCHPLVAESGGERTCAGYAGLAAMSASVPPALPDPVEEPAVLVVGGVRNTRVRSHLARLGFAAGLGAARTDDLSLAIVAVAGSLGRPGASQLVRVWRESDCVLAELRDLVAVDDPLAGREWPPPAEAVARALWLANQLCDLVQVRPFGTGALVRLHVASGG
jgi:MEDS: MEthanogen/methylotroph, DcmR Sensory domain